MNTDEIGIQNRQTQYLLIRVSSGPIRG